MRPRDQQLAARLDAALQAYAERERPLPGIVDEDARKVFIEQLLESIHRVEFVAVVRAQDISARRGDPDDEMLFEPLRAAILQQRSGNTEEAYWLVFLFVHFGKNAKGGWRYVREIYGKLGQGGRWNWASVSADPAGFRSWLYQNLGALKRDGVPGGFGNHRKYQSLDAYSATGTGATVESYVRWVDPPRTHAEMVENAQNRADADPRRAFDLLNRSMKVVTGFGRTGRFDYLTMLGKLGLAHIVPGSTYLAGATGPREGARLLFGDNAQPPQSSRTLENWLVELDSYLNVGMQVLEDALCNWQKSPQRFIRFRG